MTAGAPVRFKASPTAAAALQLDDPQIGARQVGPDLYEAAPAAARAIMDDAEYRATSAGDFGPEAWGNVRPCRAVARRIKQALETATATHGGASG